MSRRSVPSATARRCVKAACSRRARPSSTRAAFTSMRLEAPASSRCSAALSASSASRFASSVRRTLCSAASARPKASRTSAASSARRASSRASLPATSAPATARRAPRWPKISSCWLTPSPTSRLLLPARRRGPAATSSSGLDWKSSDAPLAWARATAASASAVTRVGLCSRARVTARSSVKGLAASAGAESTSTSHQGRRSGGRPWGDCIGRGDRERAFRTKAPPGTRGQDRGPLRTRDGHRSRLQLGSWTPWRFSRHTRTLPAQARCSGRVQGARAGAFPHARASGDTLTHNQQAKAAAWVAVRRRGASVTQLWADGRGSAALPPPLGWRAVEPRRRTPDGCLQAWQPREAAGAGSGSNHSGAPSGRSRARAHRPRDRPRLARSAPRDRRPRSAPPARWPLPGRARGH